MRKWYPLLFIAADLIVVVLVYPHLPQRMPAHWGLTGHVDRYGSRVEGALLMPALALGLWALLRALPAIDPRRANYARFAGSYDTVVGVAVGLLVLMHLAVLGIALGLPLPMRRIVPAILGITFIAIGNVLPRARPNWWFGVRTPWTLSNDRVWERTQRVSGYLMVAGGVVCVASALSDSIWAPLVAVVVLMAASLISIAYSYFAWKQETSR